ncbi:Sulfatase [Mariniphaga anaerophila]|uniref:Sulfatase n=1 Tax=Mariniphaga anaerophila TaxID=1484053 RepID=A0A1M4Y812_9BACT|nr:sulfatase-like hydrolase/transferase [Mariniphaga anaerophila]SHF01713.1 Sulfatase [Mariniphaga anaerophila]
MLHRNFLGCFGMNSKVGLMLLSMLIFQLSCKQKEEPSERPNILFIMTDDHSYQTISAYDNSLIETPNLDRIAEDGVIFANSFVGNSICAPSRATMLTGKHSHKNGQMTNSNTFDGTQVTFPKLLKDAGYQTALVGKWHLRSSPTGFDYWNVLPGQGEYYNPDFIEMGEKKSMTDTVLILPQNWL